MAAADLSKKFVSSESDRNDMSVNSRNLYDRSDPVQRIFFGLTQYVLNFPLLKMGPLHSAVSYIVHWLKVSKLSSKDGADAGHLMTVVILHSRSARQTHFIGFSVR